MKIKPSIQTAKHLEIVDYASGVENLKRKSFWRHVATWTWPMLCAGFITALLTLAWNHCPRLAISLVILAYASALIWSYYEYRIAPTISADSNPSCEGPNTPEVLTFNSGESGVGGTLLKRQELLSIYQDLDLLHEDYRRLGMDTSCLESVKRNVWKMAGGVK